MADVILLDGGMGQELVTRAPEAPTPLWGTKAMLDHPGMVRAVHEDYAAAGATVATTNTYALHRDRFEGTGLEGDFERLFDLALGEAEGIGAKKIAGSIGPLVRSYAPGTHPDHDVAVPLYAENARLLKDRVDFLICETIASVAHAKAALEGARTTGLPVWMAVTVDDEDGSILRSGEPVMDLAGLEADAWLANCSAPEVMGDALDALKTFGRPFGAYANGFVEITKSYMSDKPTVDKLSSRRDLGPEAYAEFALSWVEQGATIVGGCCEVGPAHIRLLAERLQQAGHQIV